MEQLNSGTDRNVVSQEFQKELEELIKLELSWRPKSLIELGNNFAHLPTAIARALRALASK